MEPNLLPSPGYYLVRILPVAPKETYGKTNIINPNADLPPEKFHQIEERYEEHPWQATIAAKGTYEPGPIMVFEPGDHVYLKTEINKRNAVLHNGEIFGYVTQNEIICKVLTPKI